jgi:hypothetical protein
MLRLTFRWPGNSSRKPIATLRARRFPELISTVASARSTTLLGRPRRQSCASAAAASHSSAVGNILDAEVIGRDMAQYGEWNRKGATLSEVTARKEYGVDPDFVVKGINAGKLEYREGAIHEPASSTTSSSGRRSW